MTAAYERGQVPPIELRHRLRIAREWAGMDQQQIAEAMGVTRSTVSNCEQGRTSPQRTTVNLWALACGVPAHWLRTGLAPHGHGPEHAMLRTEDYQTGRVEIGSIKSCRFIGIGLRVAS